MQLIIFLVIALASLTIIQAEKASRITPVRFVRTSSRTDTSTAKPLKRPARSFQELTIDVAVWTEPTVPFVYSRQPSAVGYNFGENGHVTPDFSNGLEYPDPLLLSGSAARRAVRYLYSRELFFADIPHARAMLRSQEERRANGLSGNRLGSLRISSPFYRYKKQIRLQNFL